MPHSEKFAALVDLQNILSKDIDCLIEEIQNYLEKQGILHDCVVGYDYDGKNCPILQKVEDVGFTPLPVTNRTKNNADRALIQYARKHFLRNPELNKVYLITSDGGFTRGASHFRQNSQIARRPLR
jgi:rRNA-processing protein FCF1